MPTPDDPIPLTRRLSPAERSELRKAEQAIGRAWLRARFMAETVAYDLAMGRDPTYERDNLTEIYAAYKALYDLQERLGVKRMYTI